MRMPCRSFARIGGLLVGLGLLLVQRVAGADEPAIPGYADDARFADQMKSLGTSEFAKLTSLGVTLGHRDVYVLEIGAGQREGRPALLIVGSVHPPHMLGSELALRIAQRLVAHSADDPALRKLLERMTFYVIPRPSPDACAAFFRRPYCERIGNERPANSSQEEDEGGPADLNGDGVVTAMRVEDGEGGYVEHPTDPRVMVPAGTERKEQRRFALYVEARGNDDGGPFHVPPAHGVAFDRNFPFRYPYFEPGAGPNAVSEIETRAIADFALDHPNIAAVLTFTPDDNLMQPWRPDASADARPIKTSVRPADAACYEHVSEVYREVLGRKDAPESPAAQGSFSQWVYFQYGRWSFGCRGWWIPRVEGGTKGGTSLKNEGRGESPNHALRASGRATPTDTSSSPGADDLNALRWFAQEKIDGFVPWKAIAHPDLPGRKVEIGGFRPFVRFNPPAALLEPLAEQHWTFVRRLAGLLPRVEIDEVKVEPLSAGVWRVTAGVVNRGYLPTLSEMGNITRQPPLLQVEIELPHAAKLVTGVRRVVLPTLTGGGRTQQSWLVVAGQAKPASLRVRIWSPMAGEDSRTVELADKPAKEKRP